MINAICRTPNLTKQATVLTKIPTFTARIQNPEQMNEIDSANLATLASKYANSTNRHIFLTGRAGTGKTTFLKSFVKKTHKKCVVAAPTGIAAINAGGVTLHSLLQLPFGCFIPAELPPGLTEINVEINTPRTIGHDRRMNKVKQTLLREIELLVIDEVSMLRADLLDAIDAMLRSVRRQRYVPFGGVQMLFIGDLLQLPPVVKDNEWRYLSPFYKSAYFFEAHALKNNPPVYIELDKIYRQTDQDFIELLGRFRNNNPSPQDLDRLNESFTPDYSKKIDEGYIFITTHNYKADEKNKNALKSLKGKTFTYSATVENEFAENNYPLEFNLILKKGARVMFVKNDPSGEGKYFNGKIGTVHKLDTDEVVIEFDDNTDPVTLEKYTWENKRYTLHPENNEIEEKIVGTFTHYPVKLAWAVTVHKSQGLTFDKAVLDLAGAFAPGQVYVALSRLRSLKGLALSSRLMPNNLNIDQHVSNYSTQKTPSTELDKNLDAERITFIGEQALKAFNFNPLKSELVYHYRSYDKDAGKSTKQKFKLWAGELLNKMDDPLEVSKKFVAQISKITQSKEPDIHFLHQRIIAAKNYFEPILKDFSKLILDHIKTVSDEKKVKAYISELKDVENTFFRQLYFIYKCEALLKSTLEDSELSKESIKKSNLYKDRKEVAEEIVKISPALSKSKEKKPPKPKTQDVTYDLYLHGKTIEEIAKERGLTVGTIQGHFLPFLKKGIVKITHLVDKKRAELIAECITETEATTISEVRQVLGDDYGYGEIRLVWASMELDDKE